MQKILEDRRLLLPVLLAAVAIAVGSLLIIVLSDDASGGGGGGGGAASAPTSSGQPAAAGSTKVNITDFKFMPATITVKAGSQVTWVNNDAAPHTATSGDGAFDTNTLKKGDTKTVTLDKPGSYAYVCNFHPFMKATVVVR